PATGPRTMFSAPAAVMPTMPAMKPRIGSPAATAVTAVIARVARPTPFAITPARTNGGGRAGPTRPGGAGGLSADDGGDGPVVGASVLPSRRSRTQRVP